MKTLLGAALALICCTTALAQTYPDKPIRIVAPFAPGGNVDITARAIGQALSEVLGATVVIDNRAGAAGLIGADLVAKSPPDGYTILLGSNGPLSIGPVLYPKIAYDAQKDFAAISMLSITPLAIVAHPSIPARNVKEFIALLKARPGKLTMASSGTGTSNHLAGELFQNMTGTKMIHVPYKGSGPALVDLIGGQVDLLFDQLSSSGPHIRAGKLRALAVTTEKRSPQFPELPTIDESGLKGYEASTFAALLAPAGTPKDIIARLNAAIQKALGSAFIKDRFAQLGSEPAGGTPEQFAAVLAKDSAKWAKVIRAAGIKLE